MSTKEIIDAVLEATCVETGFRRAQILGTDYRGGAIHARRLCAWVAHKHFGATRLQIEFLFLKCGFDFPRAIEVVGREIIERPALDLLVRRIRDSARTIIALRAKGVETVQRLKPGPRSRVAEKLNPTAVLTDLQIDEARRLLAKGWSMYGLARRYRVPPDRIASLVGVEWGVGA